MDFNVRSVPEADIANSLTHAKHFAVQLISVPHVKRALTERCHLTSSCISTSTHSHQEKDE